MTDTNNSSNWEQSVIEKMLDSTIVEQRRKRRWGIFFKLLFFVYLLALLYLMWPNGDGASSKLSPHASVIPITGMIGPGSKASADNVIENLNKAFEDSHTLGVILDINSPGGTPVQSDYIYTEIKRLRKLHPTIKVYAVCEDMCTSGAYYVASSADEIYANEASLVGSIGVLINGFGFVDAMQKVGVERRLLTAGSNKGMLDPFSPEDPQQKQYVLKMLEEVHSVFIDRVKQGRGNRLKDDPTLFTGLVWAGQDALKLGLIDGFKSINQVANDVLKTKKMVSYQPSVGFLDRISGDMGSTFGGAVFDKVVSNAGQMQ